MDRTNLVTAGIFFLLLAATSSASAEDLQIQGKSLFTFSGQHFVIQAEKAFYLIEKRGLPPATLSRIENSTGNSETISVDIPRSEIDYIWPNPDSLPSGKVAEVIEEPKAEKGRIILRGSLNVSFSEEHFLVVDQNSVYHISKSSLSDMEIEKFSKAGFGAHLVIAVPEEAIKGTWTFIQAPSRKIASIEEPDSANVHKSMLTLRGTILYSADNRFVIVQSGPTIYRLRRNGIGTKRPELLDLNGSRVNLTVAVANIVAYW